jgi:succinyl-CoA synthetase beta subunit
MNIHEYQAKELLAIEGVPLPGGRVASSPDQAEAIAAEMGCRVVIKAQVHAGGRGKAGGVKLAESPEEARKRAGEILGMSIKGLTVEKVLVEQALSITKEYYLGITLDRSRAVNVIIFSPMGGVDIEEVARTSPDMIFREPVDPLMGLQDFQKRNLAYRAGLGPVAVKSLCRFIDALYRIYVKYDCTLAEINPLALQEDGTFIAADAKINIDDNALFRHGDLLRFQDFAVTDPIEKEAKVRDISYVRLSGDIGIIGNGAGLVMCTLDMVDRAGGRVANFLDIGGGARAETVEKSVDLVLMDRGVRGLFINIFGGITRCDEVARGVSTAIQNLQVKVPVVIRLCGTNETEGRKILAEAGFNTVETMLEGAARIVEMARA